MIKILVKGASGKMGQRILVLANQDPNFKIVGDVRVADLLIDFSHPDVTLTYLELAASAGKAAVVGTTGHTQEQLAAIKRFAKRLPFVFSSNMSIGVNVMWKLIGEAARKLGGEFNIHVQEVHHTQKKDKPSGTAREIARILAETLKVSPEKIPIESIRKGDVVGIHKTFFDGGQEILEISHQARSRDIFAVGALRAAKWIVGRPPGLYSMQDVLGL